MKIIRATTDTLEAMIKGALKSCRDAHGTINIGSAMKRIMGQIEANADDMPCPFCGGEVDPEGWLGGDGRRGPECNDCGATAPSMAMWNRRASIPINAALHDLRIETGVYKAGIGVAFPEYRSAEDGKNRPDRS